MASYRLRIKPSAAKDLEGLPINDRRRIVERIAALADEPRPAGCEKLSGLDKFRVRQGRYRVLYAIDDATHAITVVKIGHRRDVYR